MTEDMIEDMTLNDKETEEYVQRFLANLKLREDANCGRKYYYKLRDAIWDTFKKELFYVSFITLFAESCSVGYTVLLINIIDFIKDEEAPISQGIILVALFGIMMIISSITKNYYIYTGFV